MSSSFQFLFSVSLLKFSSNQKKTHTLKFMNPKLIWLWGLLLKQGWTRSRSERRGQRCRGQIIYTTSQERPPSGVSRAPLKQTNQTRRIRAKKKCSKKTETCNVSSLFGSAFFSAYSSCFRYSVSVFFLHRLPTSKNKRNQTESHLRLERKLLNHYCSQYICLYHSL